MFRTKCSFCGTKPLWPVIVLKRSWRLAICEDCVELAVQRVKEVKEGE